MRMTNRIKLSEGLYKGDCLDLLKDVEDNSVDLICADLPYAQTKNSWDILISLDSLWGRVQEGVKGTRCSSNVCTRDVYSRSNVQQSKMVEIQFNLGKDPSYRVLKCEENAIKSPRRYVCILR